MTNRPKAIDITEETRLATTSKARALSLSLSLPSTPTLVRTTRSLERLKGAERRERACLAVVKRGNLLSVLVITALLWTRRLHAEKLAVQFNHLEKMEQYGLTPSNFVQLRSYHICCLLCLCTKPGKIADVSNVVCVEDGCFCNTSVGIYKQCEQRGRFVCGGRYEINKR